MKTNYILTFVITIIFSIASANAFDTYWHYGCDAKPAYANDPMYNWNDSKMTFSNGILNVSTDGSPLYPSFDFEKIVDIRTNYSASFKIKTNAQNKLLKIELIKSTQFYSGIANTAYAQINGDGEWHILKINFDEKEGWVPDYNQYLVFSFREDDFNDTFASGVFQIDEVSVGADITTAALNIEESSVLVYPTIVDNILNIRSGNSVVELDIFNITGTKCVSMTGRGVVEVNVSDLSSGSYIAVVKSGCKITTKHFIKK